MTASFTASDLLRELEEVEGLLKSRSANATGGYGAMSASLARGVSSKIAHMTSLDKADAILIFDRLAGSSLPSDFKASIQEAVDKLLIGASCSATSVKPQWLLDINNYFTRTEWDRLESKDLSYQSKVQVVVDRLVSLQVQSMHEQSVKYAVALLLTSHFTDAAWPTPQSIHTMLVDFKRCFQAAEKHGVSRLLKYPSCPNELPADLFARAYPDKSDPPITKTLERMRLVAEQYIPLRSTSRMLKTDGINTKEQVHPSPIQAATEPFDFRAAMSGAMMYPQLFQGYPHIFNRDQIAAAFQHGFFGRQMPQALQNGAPEVQARISPASSPEAIHRDLKLPSAPSTALVKPADAPGLPLSSFSRHDSSQLAEDDEEEEIDTAPEQAAAKQSKPKTSDDYETATYEALMKKAAMKRPAAAPTKPSKQLKSTGSPDTIAASIADAKKLNKKTFTSRHYHAAHTAAKKQGNDDCDAKAVAREAYRKAAEIWEANQ